MEFKVSTLDQATDDIGKAGFLLVLYLKKKKKNLHDFTMQKSTWDRK